MSDLPPEPMTESAPTDTVTDTPAPKKRRSRFITRPLRIVMEIVFAIVFIAAVGVGGLMWRLDQGPIALEPVLPTLQSGLADIVPGMSFKIDRASLEPGNRWRAFHVRLYGVTIGNQAKKPIGNLQEMILGFSWRNFFNLTLIPSFIEIQRPTIQVTRFPSGHIGFNLTEETAENEPQAPLPEFASLMATTLKALYEVRIVDAYISYTDQKDPFSFTAKDGLFTLKNERGVVSGTLALDVKAEKFEQNIRGVIKFDPEKEVTHFTVGLKDLPPDQLADFLPQIPSEIQLKMPANVMLTATVDKAFKPIGIDMQVTGKTGTLTYAPYYPEPIKLSNLLLTAHYDLLTGSFDVSELYAMLDEARLRAQASLKRSTDPARPATIEVLGLLENFPVNGLKSYWPNELAVSARTWIVDHLREGLVDRAGLSLQATLDKDNKFQIGSVGGKIKFHGMKVDYLPPMLPVKNVSAEAQYDLKNFDIAVEKGELLGTNVDSAAINITGFDQQDQIITLDINTKGPAQDVIKVIEAKPLEYPQKLGFSSSQFSGDATTHVQLKFPLRHDLELSQVDMTTKALLTNVTAKNVVKDLTVSGDEMTITVDTDKLTLVGNGRLADAKAKMSWQEFFGDKEEYTTILELDGVVTPNVLKGLRLPVDAYVKGSVDAKVNVKQDRKKTTFVTVDASLAKADIAFPELRIEKKAGSEGRLKLNVTALSGGATTLSNISASWPQFALNDGTVRWNAKDELDTATLKGMTVGRGKVDVEVTPSGSNAIKAVLRGDTIDLSSYWTAPTDPNAKPSQDTRRYDLNLVAHTLYLDPKVPLQNVQAAISIQQGALITANMVADTDQKGMLRLKQTVLPTGGRQLAMTVQNAGRVFEALDITDTVTGGTFQVNGKSTKEAPAVIAGTAELKNFTIVKAPVLARIINAFSPGGLIELLDNKGLVFSKMSSEFSLEKPHIIRLKKGRMTGASIGMSFQGRVYRDTGTVNISGTIVPVEGLNKMVGKIPVIGQILTGLKGEGLIAATYKVKGKTDNPEVSVNPLSALAPGILRSIFFERNED